MMFKEKFIAFIDVLGFKNMVEASESGEGMPLSELLENLSKLGSKEDEEKYRSGPKTCPNSPYLNRDLDFKLTQISDCVIVSSEVSPAGVINLISHCSTSVMGLLVKGIMCRGYITKGSIFHKDSQVIGSGYQNAFAKESQVTAFKRKADERGTPFVEIDSTVSQYVENLNDSCVREMFSRMVKTEDGVTALFPFKRFSHSFLISGYGIEFDPEKEKESNQNMRNILMTLKERVLNYVDLENQRVMEKVEHYVYAIEQQLILCDRTDEMIDQLSQPATRDRIKFPS